VTLTDDSSSTSSLSRDPSHGGARVLVVEDDDEARAALRKLLELRGYAVSEAADGHGAVNHALAHRPKAVVIDIGLPDLDGYGVARRIREGLAGAPMCLIALTGYHEIEDRARREGFDAHLIKPLKFEQLFQLLDRASRTTAPR
jgi:CheY-like chemotaxis protein